MNAHVVSLSQRRPAGIDEVFGRSDPAAVDRACCAVCGCVGGPCTSADLTRACPLIASGRPAAVGPDVVDAELLGLGMASFFLLGSVLLALG